MAASGAAAVSPAGKAAGAASEPSGEAYIAFLDEFTADADA